MGEHSDKTLTYMYQVDGTCQQHQQNPTQNPEIPGTCKHECAEHCCQAEDTIKALPQVFRAHVHQHFLRRHQVTILKQSDSGPGMHAQPENGSSGHCHRLRYRYRSSQNGLYLVAVSGFSAKQHVQRVEEQVMTQNAGAYRRQHHFSILVFDNDFLGPVAQVNCAQG